MEQAKINKTGKEIENIQIVKLDSNNKQRPYTFNVLDKNLLEIIQTHEKSLKFLINSSIKITEKDWLNLYPEVLKRLYNNQNQFDLIYQLFSLLLQKKHKNFFAIETILKINNNFLNGNKKQEEKFMIDDKKVSVIKGFGLDLKSKYKFKKADNKLGGISYRLLNALKTKNNLTSDEEKMFSNALADLKMTFVDVSGKR